MRYAIIPARGNSKGIPRKNMYPVAGKPLLWYTISNARNSGMFDKIIVSSEDEEILEYARSQGVIACVRPSYLSEDGVSATKVVLWHLSDFESDDVIVLLQPTSPIRTSSHISACLEAF